ncbi:hypothetical protein KPH14_002931 [Odynerus spinipes]|uniref:Uncharacterized protein n=1 Tax=Odynerus spinipes TaxID=1348599 RepID=A0AAD9RWZ4_9HYME|nr:hypothetical protein KPH14_002931 [Odynerus spinipes]
MEEDTLGEDTSEVEAVWNYSQSWTKTNYSHLHQELVYVFVLLLTANKDEGAEQEHGFQRPTGHPGLDRYVDSASS